MNRNSLKTERIYSTGAMEEHAMNGKKVIRGARNEKVQKGNDGRNVT
jgi:hypothetical protein